MNAMSMRAEIQCDDCVETLIFQRTIWKPGDELLEFSIMDSYIGKREYQGVLGRFRRAWHAFFAKPICYTGVVIMEKERARVFLKECLDILNPDKRGLQDEATSSVE